jgi:hypothetical protein
MVPWSARIRGWIFKVNLTKPGTASYHCSADHVSNPGIKKNHLQASFFTSVLSRSTPPPPIRSVLERSCQLQFKKSVTFNPPSPSPPPHPQEVILSRFTYHTANAAEAEGEGGGEPVGRKGHRTKG